MMKTVKELNTQIVRLNDEHITDKNQLAVIAYLWHA